MASNDAQRMAARAIRKSGQDDRIWRKTQKEFEKIQRQLGKRSKSVREGAIDAAYEKASSRIEKRNAQNTATKLKRSNMPTLSRKLTLLNDRIHRNEEWLANNRYTKGMMKAGKAAVRDVQKGHRYLSRKRLKLFRAVEEGTRRKVRRMADLISRQAKIKGGVFPKRLIGVQIPPQLEAAIGSARKAAQKKGFMKRDKPSS